MLYPLQTAVRFSWRGHQQMIAWSTTWCQMASYTQVWTTWTTVHPNKVYYFHYECVCVLLIDFCWIPNTSKTLKNLLIWCFILTTNELWTWWLVHKRWYVCVCEDVSPLAEHIFSHCRPRSPRTPPRPASPRPERSGWSPLRGEEHRHVIRGEQYPCAVNLGEMIHVWVPTRHKGTGVQGLYLEDAPGAIAEPQPQADAQEGEPHPLITGITH